MAEAFARAYGSDILIAASAGLTPASGIAPDTAQAMSERGLDLGDHHPKSVQNIRRLGPFDLVVNMSAFEVPDGVGAEVRNWDVPDPVFMEYDEHCEVRDAIERRVMDLILELRSERKRPQFRAFGSGAS